jgi:hypothetical protein
MRKRRRRRGHWSIPLGDRRASHGPISKVKMPTRAQGDWFLRLRSTGLVGLVSENASLSDVRIGAATRLHGRQSATCPPVHGETLPRVQKTVGGLTPEV